MFRKKLGGLIIEWSYHRIVLSSNGLIIEWSYHRIVLSSNGLISVTLLY